MILFEYFCIVILVLLVYWHHLQTLQKLTVHEKIKNFPGTNFSLPLIGDLYLLLAKWSIHDKIKNFIRLNHKYRTTFKVWFGTKLVIMINDPEDIKTVLTSPYCLDKPTEYQITIGGKGLFVVNGTNWKNQRRHLITSFNPKVVGSYCKEFNEFGRQIVAALKLYTITDEAVDITPIVGTHVTDLIIRTLYGNDNHEIDLSTFCYNTVEHVMMAWGGRTFETYLGVNLFRRLAQQFFRIVSNEKRTTRTLRSELQPIFDQKLSDYLKSDKKKETEESFLEKITRLNQEGTIGTTEYRHTILTMFMAGTETSARSITIIILMLAIHQEYQQKVYEEICNFLQFYGDNDIELSKLNELSLLDRVIKEALRLFPTVPFIGRRTNRDIVINEGVIPASTDVAISIINLHRNRHIWGEDSHKFNPDNFLPENVAARDRCSYLPFSYGPRNCIGFKFAQFATFMSVLYMIKNYKFQTPLKLEDVKMGYGLTSFLLNDTKMSVEPR